MELKQIKEKYGNVELEFNDYYKYSFNYKGTTEDGEQINVSVGGSAEDIYRIEIIANKKETINSLSPYFISITKDNKIIVDWMET